jgi:hypothetical protein
VLREVDHIEILLQPNSGTPADFTVTFTELGFP